MALIQSFSGVRGIYGRDLTESVAVRYAYSYCSFLKDKTGKNKPVIVIGMDTRPSSSVLCDSIMGVLDCDFIDVGIAPTPAVELAVRHFKADGGIIVTASHNEPYWNGFKFLGSSGAVLSSSEMERVIRDFRRESLKNFHRIQERSILEKNTEAIEKYADFVFDIVGRENIQKIKSSGQRVVVDPNGGAGAAAKKMLERAGAEVIGVNMAYGDFNRKIEPGQDSLFYLKNIIDENKADFAAGFDCDADRAEIIMGSGRLLSGNQILALIADEVLSGSKSPKNSLVVVNDATSGLVAEIVRKHGAKTKEVEVGETNVVQEMYRAKAVLGGEGSSGGVILPPSRCRDGILALLMVLSITAKKNKKLSELVEGLPAYFNLKKKIEFKPDRHDKIKKYLKSHYSKKGLETKEISGIKGSLKVITGKSSFVWFRASKTESGVFRIITDSCDEKEAQKLMEGAVAAFNVANG